MHTPSVVLPSPVLEQCHVHGHSNIFNSVASACLMPYPGNFMRHARQEGYCGDWSVHTVGQV